MVREDRPEVNHLRGVTTDGEVFDLALNKIPGNERSEWAGATFSPKGQTLFVNIQDPGVTFASGALAARPLQAGGPEAFRPLRGLLSRVGR